MSRNVPLRGTGDRVSTIGAELTCRISSIVYLVGGQGDAVLAALAADAPEAAARVLKVGVTEVPKSGENSEVLRAHGLDAESSAARVICLHAV
jgi:hypothetical protein